MKEIRDALEYLKNSGLISFEKYNEFLVSLQKGESLDSLKDELIDIYENRNSVFDDIEIIDIFDDIFLLNVNDFKIDNMIFTKLNFSDYSVRVFKNDSGVLGSEMFSRFKEQSNYTDLFLNSINNQFFSEVMMIDYSNIDDPNIRVIRQIYSDKNILFSNMFNFYILRERNHDDVLARITNNSDVQIIPFDNVYQDSSNEYDEMGNGESASKGYQKTYSTVAGRMFSDENGFMNFLFISFLTGISIGIISMIFINLFA